MNTKMVKLTVICGLSLLLVFIVGMLSPSAASTGSILPAGAVVSDVFKPGYGAPIGKIQRVKGEVVIMHAGVRDEGFRARPELPLYRGDTVITMEKGKIRFRLNDGSILSLASRTKLELSKSVYDQKKKSRSSFMNMAFGKARFLVVKLLNFKRSEFKVKTPTAVCGVRGSDFTVEASLDVTSATAFKATTIEIAGLIRPEAEPMILNEYEMSKVYADGFPTDKIKLEPEEIQRLKEPFISVDPDDAEPEEDEIQAGTAADAVAQADAGVRVPEEAIVDFPEDFETKEVKDGDIFKSVEGSDVTGDRPSTIRSDIAEQAKEGYLIGDLPDFPATP